MRYTNATNIGILGDKVFVSEGCSSMSEYVHYGGFDLLKGYFHGFGSTEVKQTGDWFNRVLGSETPENLKLGLSQIIGDHTKFKLDGDVLFCYHNGSDVLVNFKEGVYQAMIEGRSLT
jgi:hypothetical protein